MNETHHALEPSRRATATVALLFGASLVAGCFATTTQTRPSNSHGHGGNHAACEPAHHLENGRCVHNGNGHHRGHD